MDFVVVNTNDKIAQLYSCITKNSVAFLDIETDSLDEFTANLLLLQVEISGDIFVVDVRTIGLNNTKFILESLINNKYLIVGHNIKFDCKVLYNIFNIKFPYLYDTMIAEVLINQGVGSQYYSYQALVEKYLNIVLDKSTRDTFADFSGELTQEQIIYSSLDVKYLNEIRKNQLGILVNQKQDKVLKLEMDLLPIIIDMELEGMLVDKDRWLKLEKLSIEKSSLLEKNIKEIILSNIDLTKITNAYELTQLLFIPVKSKKLKEQLELIKDIPSILEWIFENLNISSYVQLKVSLNLMGISVPNTNENTLKKFRNKNPIIDLILTFKELNKRISTYGESFLSRIHPKTGKLHADINQVGTKTGRFSITKGLHQIPRSSDDVPEYENYRSAFIAGEGYKLICADYSQMEYRVLGSITGDPEITKAYKNGLDLHTMTAEKIGESRKVAKNVNFGMLYGITSYGLYNRFDIPVEKGEVYLSNLYSGYKVFYAYMRRAHDLILEKGLSRTAYGRIRFFEKPTLYKDHFEKDRIESEIKREGFNHIIQGTSADIVKLAMININNFNPFGDKLKIILQVHDEIICKVHETIIDSAADFITDCMTMAEAPFLGEIPPGVDIKIGDYWK